MYKTNVLPPILKTTEEVLRTYPEECQSLWDSFVKSEWYGYMKPEVKRKMTMKDYINDQLYMLSAVSIDLDDELLKIADENKDKIFARCKKYKWAEGKDWQVMLFWHEFKLWYDQYKEKLKREEQKRLERERKEQREQERINKKNEKLKYTQIKDIFDKGPNDVIWKSLLELKKENKKFFNNIAKEYNNLKESDKYYVNEIWKTGDKKFIKELNSRGNWWAKQVYLDMTKHYGLDNIQIALKSDKELDKYLTNDIDYKYADLVKRVIDKIGTNITEAKLKNSVNGSVNGFIKSDKGTTTIETILAWGEVYKPHYRVLVR